MFTGLRSPDPLVGWEGDTPSPFPTLDYANDVVLLADESQSLSTALNRFHEEALKLGLHVSRQKTKVQNLGEGVTAFRYLGSIQSSSGRSRASSYCGHLYLGHIAGTVCKRCSLLLVLFRGLSVGHCREMC